MKKYKIGLTTGVYDMFHIGHLNLLKNAKKQCDFLIVGVSTDEVVLASKGKKTIIPYDERVEIVESIRYVDKVIAQTDYDDKLTPVLKHHVDVLFVGSDWKGTEKWNRIESELKTHNVDVVYLPHTDGVSSSLLRGKLNK